MDDFRALADSVAADIAAGRLRAGDRLPTQRRYARDQRVAVSTASRVYGELTRRGLVTGEVGRGTFVRAASSELHRRSTEPAGGRIDLELNFPILPGQNELIARSLQGLLRPDSVNAAFAVPTAAATGRAREAASAALTRPGWTPEPGRVLFAGNGRQAVAAAISAAVPVGGRLGVEYLTYPVVRGIATRLGVELVPLQMDDDGVLPDAIAAAGPLSAIYVQPTVHNPLGITMPERRRAELAELLGRRELYAIEDNVNAFLHDDGPPPLAALAPERTTVIDSLSKRLAPGLSVGYVVPAPALAGRAAGALRGGGWTGPTFAVAATTRVVEDGTLRRLEDAKRADAVARQQLVAERLAGFPVRGDRCSYYVWWRLPGAWRAETFVAAAARAGIGVTPAASFAVGAGHAPSAVRLALSMPSLSVLGDALDTLAALARSAPGDDAGTE